MPQEKTTERCCERFGEDIEITVGYKIVTTLGGNGPVPLYSKCSLVPNGNCPYSRQCTAIRAAEDDIRERKL